MIDCVGRNVIRSTNVHFLMILLLILTDLKIKRCGEMARKIRFFKDQMSKAGVLPKEMLGKENDIDLDDVEVKWRYLLFIFYVLGYFFSSNLLFGFSGKAWRARS